MAEKKICAECGREIPASAPGGHCPACMARLVFGSVQPLPHLQEAIPGTEQSSTAEPAQKFIIEAQLDLTGQRIGRYKLLERIGEGGFGEVYMAEQIEPVQRKVAFKIIKAGMDSRQIIARFEAERQALALMDHPNIAKVLDAGTTETGRPYFVMELVRGISITSYCDQKRLSTTDRLQLFIEVCHAVQHAHQKGIIHRDIKPSNVLVTLHDGKAVPKVIDFGISKALGQKLTDKTLFTGFAQLMGTPAYMSPEQAELSGLDIDTRSDIYSLGVLLYELLTGVTPFDKETMAKAALDEIRRMIRETDPPRPSTRVETLGAKATEIAKDRQTEPEALRKLVRGDLDWIVMKCLEKDRTRRYETANGLVSEIQRYLSNEPVVARPPSNLYRFQKLVRRNKLAFTVAGAVVTSLVLGLAVSSWLFIRERKARQETRTEAAKSAQVAHFLEQMLQSVGPSVAQGRDTALLREVLDRTADRIGTELKTQPLVEAELRSTIGEVYRALGDSQKAEAIQRQALDLRRELLGKSHPSVANSLDNLAKALWKNKKYSEAEAAERESLAIRRKLFGNDNLEVATSLFDLGRVLMSEKKLSEAESAQREALAIRKKLLGDVHVKVAESLSHLAEVLLKENRDSEASELSQQAMDITTRLGKSHSATIDRVQANLLEKQGKVAEAEKIRREELDRQKLILGLEHPDVASSLSSLSKGYQESGQLSNAIVLAEKAFQSLKSKFGATNSQTLGAFANLAILYGQARRPSEVRALEKELKGNDLAQEGMLKALHNLGIAYRGCGSYEDSLRVWRRAAEKGDARCTASIGWAYANGAGVPKDRKEALKWYIKSAELGDLRSFRNIGVMYEDGSGGATNMDEAIKWFTRGAEAGETDSQITLARHYRLGQGCATNLTEAAKWYEKAAAAGNPTGLVGLLLMAQRGQIAESSARLEQQVNKAADQADVSFKYALARWYETGEGLSKDLTNAARWYAKVTENARAGELNNLAWRLATASEAGARDGTNAIVFAEKAVALTQGGDANNVDTLAAAYAEAGDFRKAVATEEQAITLLREDSAKREFQTRLDLYRAGGPYHVIPTATPEQQDASNQ